jgi:phospholipid/cholesterol/gamma-HCH transport system permease protein
MSRDTLIAPTTAMRSDSGLGLASGLLVGLGRSALVILEYLGGIGVLFGAALRTLWRPSGAALPLVRSVERQLLWLFGVGIPLVGISHIGMGSFLAMQAYFGATFVEGAGAVVGLGLIRNVAPLLSGMLLAGIMAARWVPELGFADPIDLEADPVDIPLPDRDVAQGLADDDREPPELARLVLTRVLAAMIAGPVLAIWGSAIGMLIGWAVSTGVLQVPSSIFFGKFLEMLWLRDALGLSIKPALFGMLAALIICHEGLRLRPEVTDEGSESGTEVEAELENAPDPDPVLVPVPQKSLMVAGARAACLATLVILGINLSWFLLVYLAGPAFGPTILEPPSV